MSLIVTVQSGVGKIRTTHAEPTDFSNQWGLGAIRADYAYAHLELSKGASVKPGEGVTVGFIDTGIDLDHPLFRGATKEEFLLASATDESGSDVSHGTAVASVVGANPESLHADTREHGFYGVARGAHLKMFAIPLANPPPPDVLYAPTSSSGLARDDEEDAALYQSVLGRGVDILNLSFGVPGIIENYGARDIRNRYGRTIAALAQTGTQDKTILVWAAGNAHGRSCAPGANNCAGGSIDARSVELFPGLVARIQELRGHSIAVAAVDRNGNIAGFSNRCGIAADWCIAAPGAGVAAAYFGPHNGVAGSRGMSSENGTSFAAPMVSGGLAVMKQLFRDQLSNTALVTRLFATANKDGRYEDRAIYGQGMLDLGAATSPVGETGIASGNTVGSPGVNIHMTGLRLGGALGDGLRRSLATREIVAFDSLGAPFWFNLAEFTGAARGPSSLVRLHELTAQSPIARRAAGRLTTFTPARAGGAVEQDLGYAVLRFGFREQPRGAEGGHFSLADNATTLTIAGSNGMAFTTFTASGFAGRSPTSGVTLSWRPFDVPVGFRVGWLAEQATVLGTMATGAFGRLSAEATVAGLETGFEIGPWRLAANAEIGAARPRLQGGILSRLSALTTSAFAFKATRRLAHGGLVRIALSQPLRVEDGLAALSVPVGRTKDGDVLRQPVSADPVPSGRQLNVSAQWRHSVAHDNELRVEAAWIHNPGHNARAKPAVSVLAGWRFEF